MLNNKILTHIVKPFRSIPTRYYLLIAILAILEMLNYYGLKASLISLIDPRFPATSVVFDIFGFYPVKVIDEIFVIAVTFILSDVILINNDKFGQTIFVPWVLALLLNYLIICFGLLILLELDMVALLYVGFITILFAVKFFIVYYFVHRE